MKGTVKTLKAEKGFGFIRGKNGKDYFFHKKETEIFDSMIEGQDVEFEDISSAKGPRATDIKVE